MYWCPLAMTDGAIKTLKIFGDQNNSHVTEALLRMTSRNPDYFWTSGKILIFGHFFLNFEIHKVDTIG